MTRHRFVSASIGAAVLAAGSLFAAAPAPAPQAKAAPAAKTTLTPEQRAALREELGRYLRRDADGLVAKASAGGGTIVELDGRYAHVMFVRPKADGGRELACFADPDAATAFLAGDDLAAAAPVSHVPQGEERDR